MLLEKKHYTAIRMILNGSKVTDVAKEVKVSRATIYNWLDDKDFSKEMDLIRGELQSSTKNYLESNVKLYVDTIEELALKDDTSTKVRADLLKYLVNRVLGNTTVKTEVKVNDKETDEEFNINKFIKDLNNNTNETK